MDNSNIGHHISEQFNRELEDIRNNVLTMGGLVEEQIELAIKAFTTADQELAEQVIKQDNQIERDGDHARPRMHPNNGTSATHGV